MDGMKAPIVSQIIQEIKSELQRGWIFINFGLFLLMWGVSWLFWGIYSYFDPPAEFTWDKMMLPAILFGLSGILFGVLAYIFGIRTVKSLLVSVGAQQDDTQTESTDIRLGGWSIATVGGLLTFWGVLFGVLTIYNLVILRGTPDATTDVVGQVGCFLPGLVIGLPLLLIGSRMIIFRNK